MTDTEVLRFQSLFFLLFQVNGSLKVGATEVKDDEKEQKSLTQSYLELALSSISIGAVIISLIILSCLRYLIT